MAGVLEEAHLSSRLENTEAHGSSLQMPGQPRSSHRSASLFSSPEQQDRACDSCLVMGTQVPETEQDLSEARQQLC